VRRAVAFAPGHVTGFFRPDLRARDPRARGSTGAGLVLEVGATAQAEWRPTGPTRVTVVDAHGAPMKISSEVARRLVASRPGRLAVKIYHDLPVGQGFGMSAAGALATGLAVAELLRETRRRAVEVAHLAELYGGGGLGGVAAILGGGMERRVRAGVPPFGRVVHRPYDGAVAVGVLGPPLPSPRILRDGGHLRALSAAADAAEALAPGNSIVEFVAASEAFTDRAGLASRPLQLLLRELRATGAGAAQAMFGRSFFALPRTERERRAVLATLQRRGVRAIEVRTARSGARRLRASGAPAARAGATILTDGPSSPPP
jgi:pantoate kinase